MPRPFDYMFLLVFITGCAVVAFGMWIDYQERFSSANKPKRRPRRGKK